MCTPNASLESVTACTSTAGADLAYGFNKLVAVANTFETYPDLKHVLYLDADALIVNIDINILDIAALFHSRHCLCKRGIRYPRKRSRHAFEYACPRAEVAKFPVQGGAMLFETAPSHLAFGNRLREGRNGRFRLLT